ncbi:MepB family protein [Shewanella sp.]|uniref:MepB family protein n=1 Tax=Shewanella sp. TaxID=50422 RepID=UPI0025E1A24B|nr:MepB family protein [Shewanella sp.]
MNKNYRDELESLLVKVFVPAGYKITKKVELDPVPESSKYEALNFSLNDRSIVYRKGKVTADRPGAFLAVWQRPDLEDEDDNGNKPIPLTSSELDYLFIYVESHSNISETLEHSSKYGMFIFPASLLIEKGIVSSVKSKGKTGFRVFPPWSQDRGIVGTKVFSESGKKTQRWQIPFFLEIDDNGLIDSCELNILLNNKRV